MDTDIMTKLTPGSRLAPIQIESVGTPAADQRPGPLHGIRVIEVGVWHAGPGAGAILGDLGAEVIKVETLEGDPERAHGSFGPMDTSKVEMPNWTTLYEFSNRNKRSITLDITSEDGYGVLRKLVEGADVFLTNLRTSTKPKLKVDYGSIRSINPDVVHVNVSGFGQHGPMADAGGFDPLGQAISGMMFLSGNEEPALLQMIVLDQLTAIAASHAAITALLARERDGHGQEVHTSLYGSAVWLTHMNILAASLMQGKVDNSWDRLKNPPLRTTYRCGDGKWLMGTNHPEEKYWSRFCQAIGTPELEADPRFLTKADRASSSQDLFEILDAVFLTKERDEWVSILTGSGALFAPVHDIDDVLVDEQAIENGYVTDIDHRALGKIRIPGYPVEFSAHDAGPRSEAPELGEHSREILQELGYSSEDIGALIGTKIVGEQVRSPISV